MWSGWMDGWMTSVQRFAFRLVQQTWSIIGRCALLQGTAGGGGGDLIVSPSGLSCHCAAPAPAPAAISQQCQAGLG